MAELLALDTNVYIRALRDPDRMDVLKQFLSRAGSRVRINAVVAEELRAGARTGYQELALNGIVAAYVKRDRVIVPSFSAYTEAGRVLAALAKHEGRDVGRAGSLVNDVLLAASCRESEALLITENIADFAAARRHLRGFRYTVADEIM